VKPFPKHKHIIFQDLIYNFIGLSLYMMWGWRIMCFMNENKERNTDEQNQPLPESKSLTLDEIIEVTLEIRF
jgi:hypothetical protein